MRKLFGLVVVAALMASGNPVAAQSAGPTIGNVRAYCAEWDKTDLSQVEDPFLAGFCLGLVQSFRDGVTIGMASTLSILKENVTYTGRERRTGYESWCQPGGVTNQLLAGVFMSWSSGKPDYWHLPYSIGLLEAFREQWPCGQDDSAEQPVIELETQGSEPQK